MNVDQLLELTYDTVAEAAPDGLKKNSILKRLGQLMRTVGTYGSLCVQREMSEEGKKALARAEREDKLWVRKDCGCK